MVMELVVWERENQIVWRRREGYHKLEGERGGRGRRKERGREREREERRGKGKGAGEEEAEGEGGGGRHCTCPATVLHDLTSSKHQSLDEACHSGSAWPRTTNDSVWGANQSQQCTSNGSGHCNSSESPTTNTKWQHRSLAIVLELCTHLSCKLGPWLVRVCV